MHELSTAGSTLNYCVETTKGKRPTTGYKAIKGIKSTPDFNTPPSSLEVTDLSDRERKRTIPGLRDAGGALAFGANFTVDFKADWDALMAAYKTAVSDGKAVWFEVKIPTMDSFYFNGVPSPLALSALEVDSVLEIDAYITPNEVEGFATPSTTA